MRRVTNRATYVTEYSPTDARQVHELRVEMESLAFQWAKARANEADLAELTERFDRPVEAREGGDPQRFHALDLEFHKACWELAGNRFLADVLERHVAPVSAFVILHPNADMARQHYRLIDALRSLDEPEFSQTIRDTHSSLADHWPDVVAARQG